MNYDANYALLSLLIQRIWAVFVLIKSTVQTKASVITAQKIIH